MRTPWRIQDLADIDCYDPALHADGKTRNRKPILVARSKTRTDIELPAMRKARYDWTLEHAFAERIPRMRTRILYRVDFVSNPKESYVDPIDSHA